jgi:hypothetical protein
MFLDERGTGLRVTWHPERDLVVLSVWQGDACVGTFRMSVQDVPRLSGLLAAALGDWVDQAGPAPEPGGGPQMGRDAGGAGRADAGGAGRDEAGAVGAGRAGAAAAGQGRAGLSVQRRAGLSVQQRLRLSRPVLRLRGLQHRRRRPP